MSYAGHKFLPALAGQHFANSVATHDYRLAPGMAIRPLMADLAESEYDPRYPGDDYWTMIYEVFVDGVHIATAASLEAACAVLHDKYTSTLPF